MIKVQYSIKAVTHAMLNKVNKQIALYKKLNTNKFLSFLYQKKTSTQKFLTIVFLIIENEHIQKFCMTLWIFHFLTQSSSISVIQEAKMMYLWRMVVYITWTGRRFQLEILLVGCTYLVLRLESKDHLPIKELRTFHSFSFFSTSCYLS